MKRNLIFRPSVVACALLILGLTWSARMSYGEENAQGKKRIAVLTHSGGFKHSSLGLGEEIIKKIGQESGVYEADCLEGYKVPQDKVTLDFITPEFLAKYDGLAFLTTTGEREPHMLTADQKKLLIDYFRSGHAFIGIHTATDSFYNWPEYGDLVGAYFITHGPSDQPVTIKVEDPNHPATRMLGAEWVIADEIYQFRDKPYSREKLHILLSIDTAKTDMSKQKKQSRKDRDYAVAWCREFGKGRVFYTSPGHREDVWTNKTYQQHLLGGIKYALGLEPGDATPSKK